MPASTQSAPNLAALASLAGKKGLVVGIANEHSIAYGCARDAPVRRDAGIDLPE